MVERSASSKICGQSEAVSRNISLCVLNVAPWSERTDFVPSLGKRYHPLSYVFSSSALGICSKRLICFSD